MDPRRSLPGVDRLLDSPRGHELQDVYGGAAVRRAVRMVLDAARRSLSDGQAVGVGPDAILQRVAQQLSKQTRMSLRGVLNGTGVVLHTNLGRAPLAPEAVEAAAAAARYLNLEYDLESGERDSRQERCAERLRLVSGAEAGIAVNNNAAAVALAVAELARGRDLLVSRGELVEIGGSFRLPDVVAGGGAHLVEVGTTNRTRRSDYERALSERTGAILKVHPSNFRVDGFVEETPLAELVALAREANLPLIHDVGSGLLDEALLPGFPAEPTVRASVAAGVDVVTWSADKLMGGPQAGLMAGRAECIQRIRRNPMARAFRIDKLTLAALEATLGLYLDLERAPARIPVLRMLTESADSVRTRAAEAARGAGLGGRVEPVDLRSVVGGGSFPGHEIPSAGWAVRSVPAEQLAAACRQGEPPLVGVVREEEFRVDFRTLDVGEGALAGGVLRGALERLTA